MCRLVAAELWQAVPERKCARAEMSIHCAAWNPNARSPAWTIATGETPVHYVPEGQLKVMQAYGGDAKQQQMLESLRRKGLPWPRCKEAPCSSITASSVTCWLR